jgi:hypothetical protein
MRSYPPTAWYAAENKVNATIADFDSLRAALQWHYCHTILMCWCNDELRQRGFREAWSENEVALVYNDGEVELFCPSSDSGYISDHEIVPLFSQNALIK